MQRIRALGSLAGRDPIPDVMQRPAIELNCLLPRAPVHIIEHVHSARHGAVQAQPAGDSHPGCRDGRGLRVMIHGRH